MYLISNNQIENNLKRTATKKLPSYLNRKDLISLSLKYYGVFEEGKLVGYICPYTGEKIFGDMHLDHILPVDLRGGTILFNCIPVSSKANSKKTNKLLIDWWTQESFWDPKKLEKLVNYIVEAYEIVFGEKKLEEINESYLDYLDDTSNIEEENDNEEEYENDREAARILKEQAKSNHVTSYISFLKDLVKVLDKYNIDTVSIKNRIQSLFNKGIFKDLENLEKIQRYYQDVIKELIGDDNRRFIRYSYIINILKLSKSISYKTEKDIKNELRIRFNYINSICLENNLSLTDYFESQVDIEDIDLIYKSTFDNIKSDEINYFINSIKLGFDTKLKLFIEMINREDEKYVDFNNAKNNIFSAINTLKFEGLEDGKTSIKGFWYRNNNKDRIKELLKKEEYASYDKARQMIELNELRIQNRKADEKIKLFIEMINREDEKYIDLNDAKKNIFSTINTFKFEGMEDGVKSFWSNHQDKIKDLLKTEEYASYDKARKMIELYELQNPNDLTLKKAKSFIEMINREDEKYIDFNNKEKNIFRVSNTFSFEGIDDGVKSFWNTTTNKTLVIDLLKTEEYASYDKARQMIELNEHYNHIFDKKIRLFIEMINREDGKYIDFNSTEKNIFSAINTFKFEGMEDGVKFFWSNHQDKIKDLLKTEEYASYNKARQMIELYENMNKGRNERRKINHVDKLKSFIEMINREDEKYVDLNDAKKNIFSAINTFKFEGMEDGVKSFWSNHQDKIKDLLKTEEYASYDKARRVIELYESRTQEINQISLKKAKSFIEMINREDEKYVNCEINIFNQRNQITFEGIDEGKIHVGKFWSRKEYKEKVKELLKTEEYASYDKARRVIELYELKNQEKNDITLKKARSFIEMINREDEKYVDLNNTESNIFSSYNTLTFEGMEDVVKSFWNNNKTIVKSLLKTEEYASYDKARQIIELYENMNKGRNERRKINPVDIFKSFIEMINREDEKYVDLNKAQNNIFSSYNTLTFEGIEDGKTSVKDIWEKHKDKIIKLLFFELEYSDKKYDKARSVVLKRLKVSSIEEFIDSFEKVTRKNKELVALRNKLREEKERLLKENSMLETLNDVEEMRIS